MTLPFSPLSMFDPYLLRWRLAPDGDPIVTHSSKLLPVRYCGAPAMLKIATEQEEQRGGALMVWWAGDGAARVLAQDGNTLLLERATGTKSLAEMAERGDDDEASRILCAVAAKLHAPRSSPPPELVPLPRWFEALAPAAASEGGILVRASRAAQALLSAPRDVAVLHGDIHHGNVLDFGARGWLAIDPKGLSGERGFDFANIFCNPDFALAAATGRLARQATTIAEAAGMDRKRLLQWILSYAGLSAAWFIADDNDPSLSLAIATAAAAELGERT